ncbi:MAG: hypothetical protein V4447_10545 [Pseudomonadota bacterium]
MKIKVFIHQNPYGEGILGNCHNMSDMGYVLIGEHEFEYEIPAGFDPVAAKISMLEKGLDKLERAHDTQVANIKEQIAKLQCLTFEEKKPENIPENPAVDADFF